MIVESAQTRTVHTPRINRGPPSRVDRFAEELFLGTAQPGKERGQSITAMLAIHLIRLYASCVVPPSLGHAWSSLLIEPRPSPPLSPYSNLIVTDADLAMTSAVAEFLPRYSSPVLPLAPHEKCKEKLPIRTLHESKLVLPATQGRRVRHIRKSE